MDILPLPDGVESHWLVPDLGGPDFDNQGFLGYDERQGWNVDALFRGKITAARKDWENYYTSVSQEDGRFVRMSSTQEVILLCAGSFLQTWIFYGIWQEALSRPVSRQEGSVEGPGANAARHNLSASNRYVTAGALFREFMARRDELNNNLKWADQFDRCLQEAKWILQKLDRNSDKATMQFLPLSVCLALSTLVETLDRYRRLWLDDTEDVLANSQISVPCQLLERKLISEDGWCPSIVHRVGSRLGLEGLYFASLLPSLKDGFDHENCTTRFACVASNVDVGNYQTRHVSEHCDCKRHGCDHMQPECACQHQAMPNSDLVAAFENEQFPLVGFQGEKINIIPFKPGLRYVAISHVWSDGRGNPRQNSLPMCQLRSIQHYVTALTTNQGSPFWIDTLCVPVEEPLRHLAILRMAKVYSSASQVLVLSEELLSHNLPSSPDQVLFSIFCCKWMLRLWTMQEATLAEDLRFQFADTIVPYTPREHVLTVMASDAAGLVSQLLGLYAAISIDQAKLSLQTVKHEKYPFLTFLTTLQFRSTSRPMDVTVCASILLGSGLSAVLEAQDDVKMQTFWANQEKLPASVLWMLGPRLKVDGFRWAPSDLLHPGTRLLTPSEDYPPAHPTPEGLLVNGIDAILLKDLPVPTVEKTHLRFRLPNSSQRYIVFKDQDHDKWVDMTSFWNGNCVLFLAEHPTRRSEAFAALTMPMVDLSNKECREDERHPVSARYLAGLIVCTEEYWYERLMPQGTNDFYQAKSFLNSKGMDFVDIQESMLVKTSRRWCIF
ncbi:uncharacterized protein Z519_09606 [Cladophialophora bantiana CBS 173.52]|uniref:Heterokaryon incompatibility domain-containing protein n=1 Tax=Cladophialophora bantiana (strain ATCC 10958 / CBS 173.52 / CDC B-1940 / NIH 8579) TaxID=1442370 RepID=A0A0D2HFC1_CLAB1|nr:uncharacterized protein Z519_09606 [Cladophialophora bantiana CBS 173.52]KIW89450.1 hypothetical protein Z519_09606 [Cladophialophora bantiana CBS 173.52]